MSIPAIAGGTPVRTASFSPWPVFDDEESQAVERVLRSGVWGTRGPEVEQFEQEFALLTGAEHAIGVCNGTVSLECILRALGIGRGDEVVVPAYTFIATASAVLMVGATPVFADIDPDTACIAPDSFADAVTSNTKAVIPVHMAGCPADLDALSEIATPRGIRIVEDCAQAHGARWRGSHVGTMGDAGSFSFQNSKNITAGEGGAIVTGSSDLADACWAVHNIGRIKSGEFYEHFVIASNLRLSEWQAAILRVQMRRLREQLAAREAAAAYLDTELGSLVGLQPMRRDSRVSAHAHHLYMIRIGTQELGGLTKRQFIAAMRAEGIPCFAGYTPLTRQPMLRSEGAKRVVARSIDYYATEIPGAERLCDEVIWIPQNVLLSSEADWAHVVAAAEKIVTNPRAVIAAAE